LQPLPSTAAARPKLPNKLADNPKVAAKVKRSVDRLYQAISRKRRSIRRCKAINTLAAARQPVVRQRVDHAQKVSRRLVDHYDLIAFEDLEPRFAG
jgi:putative transposase